MNRYVYTVDVFRQWIPLVPIMLRRVLTALLIGAPGLNWRTRHRLMQLALRCCSEVLIRLTMVPWDRFRLLGLLRTWKHSPAVSMTLLWWSHPVTVWFMTLLESLQAQMPVAL